MMAIYDSALEKLLGQLELLWLVFTNVVLVKSCMRVIRGTLWEMRSHESSCKVLRDASASHRLGGHLRISDNSWAEM
jgi:hypothetical protein